MAFGAIDIPTRGVDDFRATLRDRESKLAHAKRQRDTVLNDIRKANAAVDAGDKLARNALSGLNKSNLEVGRLIVSIEREVAESRKRVAMAEAQVDAACAKAAVPVTEGAERLFLVKTPHGGQVRHKARTIEELRARLLPGYTVHGEIFGANDAGEGGVVAAIEPTGPSILEGLLQAHGKDLEAWLAERGIVGCIGQAPELAALNFKASNKESAQ
jgi:hypothetical protein